MTKKSYYIWFGVFALATLSFSIIQDQARTYIPASDSWLTYALGVAPNFFAVISLASFGMFVSTHLLKRPDNDHPFTLNQIAVSSMMIAFTGLLIWEFIQIRLPKAVFDPHDILWTLLGMLGFYGIYHLIHPGKEGKKPL